MGAHPKADLLGDEAGSVPTKKRRFTVFLVGVAGFVVVLAVTLKDFEPGVAQNWAQFFVSVKSDEANSLKSNGEPGRTRTSNPLIKSSFWAFWTEWEGLVSLGFSAKNSHACKRI